VFGKRQRSYEDGVRERARELRRTGLTYTEIGEALGGNIPKSTINGWVKDIELTLEQKARIERKERDSILRSQPLAAEWHREQKRRRLHQIAEKAAPIAKRLAGNKEALMLMASALYMGEGAKAEGQFAIGNSDPASFRRGSRCFEARLRLTIANFAASWRSRRAWTRRLSRRTGQRSSEYRLISSSGQASKKRVGDGSGKATKAFASSTTTRLKFDVCSMQSAKVSLTNCLMAQ